MKWESVSSGELKQMFDLALRHHQAGRLQEAEQLYRLVIARQPDHAGALHMLGVVAHQTGRNDMAVDFIRQSLQLSPANAQAHNNLGNALKGKGQLDDAIAAYRQAVALNPGYASGHNNLGNALGEKGQLDEAIAACRRAIALDPKIPEPHNNLGNALEGKGQLEEAIAAYRRAIQLRPNFPEALGNLGEALRQRGKLDDAISAFRQAIALNPHIAEVYNHLGNALRDQGQVEHAIPAFHQAIALRPDYPNAHNNLGNALRDKGQLREAIAAYSQAIALNPNYAAAYNNLGNVLKDIGQLEGAIRAYRQAVALSPGYALAHSNLVFSVQFLPEYGPRELAEELRQFNVQHAEPLREFVQTHRNDRSPDRRLRVGYVSADLYETVVGQNFLPLLRQHDHQQFEIICYAQVLTPDQMTACMQKEADGWRSIVGLSDEDVAKKIREDGIDVLVDLALHASNNRMLVFARKPAPVQVTWLAYCGSSGMSAMDYRLSDPHFDPPDSDLSLYTEKTVRLPRTYWCYQPGGPAAEASPLPARKNGFVTFGCLNNFAKASSVALDIWTRILVAVPNSRLIIHALRGTPVEEVVVQRMAGAGIANRRLLFVGRQPWAGYTQTYSEIDIALDPFPYGGGITSCSALWMGVPMVTLSGQTPVGRGGRSILANLGLPELIAYTPDQYIQIATELAGDWDRMENLRKGMRARMLASPLMDADRFARDMEAAYRQMWQAWCSSAR